MCISLQLFDYVHYLAMILSLSGHYVFIIFSLFDYFYYFVVFDLLYLVIISSLSFFYYYIHLHFILFIHYFASDQTQPKITTNLILLTLNGENLAVWQASSLARQDMTRLANIFCSITASTPTYELQRVAPCNVALF